ncbi:MAG: uridine phosphorylase [Armatimonadota bacterium]|nr:uridine phosphorylase [Armatimonadota bacterium]MCX7777346.1 uridine phosphorylase [Armatimonadota bacterium]MDW8025386.1 uridine phosphorylase [Armatimonadota bacterium]
MAVFAGDRVYHVRCRKGEVGKYVLMPGDPKRCELIARYFEDPVKVAEHREYVTFTGMLDGVTVSVTSTGIGCPSTAIAVEELSTLGCDTFIRVGTSGAMQAHILPGDIIIGTAAIRDEGTTLHYMPVEFPAVADITVTQSLIEGAKRCGVRYHVGIVHSKDSFYGEVEPSRMPVHSRLTQRWEAWVKGGAVASEMEAAALFVVSSILGARAGCVLLAAANVEHARQTGKFTIIEDVSMLIKVAIEGLRTLIAWDREAGRI